jgi:RNA polymerase sigma-70 factor (ECF subfamily)
MAVYRDVEETGRDGRIAELIPKLRRYARALTGERAAADDLVQDTLERALSRMHLWRSGSDLRAWLFTIMHNVYVNQLRASRRQRFEALEEAAAVEEPRAREADWLELKDLEAALAQLAPEQRAVLLLVGLEQFTYGEAARVLGVPIGTVMSRLSRGRERLRAILAGEAGVRILKRVK